MTIVIAVEIFAKANPKGILLLFIKIYPFNTLDL